MRAHAGRRSIAVEQRDQLQSAAHVPAVIQQNKKVRGIIISHLRAIAKKWQQDLGHFGGCDVAQEHEVQHQLSSSGSFAASDSVMGLTGCRTRWPRE